MDPDSTFESIFAGNFASMFGLKYIFKIRVLGTPLFANFLVFLLVTCGCWSATLKNTNKLAKSGVPFHTVNFDWFLSGLECILNLELLKLLIWWLPEKHYGISDLGLILPYFEFLGLYLDVFDQNWSFVHKNEDFDQKLKVWKS